MGNEPSKAPPRLPPDGEESAYTDPEDFIDGEGMYVQNYCSMDVSHVACIDILQCAGRWCIWFATPAALKHCMKHGAEF